MYTRSKHVQWPRSNLLQAATTCLGNMLQHARNLLQNRISFFDQVGLLFGGGTYAGRLRVYGADVVEWLVELWPKLWPDWRLASAGDGGGLVAEQPRG